VKCNLVFTIIAMVVTLAIIVVSIPVQTLAASGDITTAGGLSLSPTFECISVESNFTGDGNQNNNAVLEYRQAGTGSWKTAPQMYADWANHQYRGSIFWLVSNTEYEVRVTYVDSDGVVGGPVVGTVRTRNDNPPIGTNYLVVSHSGNDETGTGTTANPYRTIQHAADIAQPGDTILIRGGTWSENVDIAVSNSGLADAYITFMPYPGEEVIFDGNGSIHCSFFISANYIRIKGFILKNNYYSCICLDGGSQTVGAGTANGCIIEDCTMENPDASGAGIHGGIIIENDAKNTLVQRNTITVNSGPSNSINGIGFWYPGWGQVIRNNVITSTTGALRDGIGGGPEDTSQYTHNWDIYNNTITGAMDDGIQIEGGDVNVRIWNNTIKDGFIGIALCPTLVGPAYVVRNTIANMSGGMFKLGDSSYGRIYIYHNTYYTTIYADGYNQTNGNLGNIVSRNNIIHAGKYVVEMKYGTNYGFDFDYDNCYSTNSPTRFIKWIDGAAYTTLALFTAATGQESHGISVADNKFTNAAGGDFTLQPTSPCIDAGVILPGFNDANSPWPYSGAAPDMGAYEYGSGGPTNYPPVLGTIGNKTVDPEETLQFTVSATDPNGDTLTYSASNLPQGATFNAQTRTFSWTPTSSQVGSYPNVHFQVSDGSLTDFENITITVLSNVNEPPVLNTIGNKSVSEGELLQFTVSATDPEGDTLTYSASNLPAGSTFKAQTRTFSWTPAPGQMGSYLNVHFEVTDGELTDFENISITVLSESNEPPVLNTIGNKSVNEGELLQFTVSATDAEGDTLTYSATNLPQGATFNAQTRTFSWTPTSSQVGSYPNVHFEVSDGELIDYENITITVTSDGDYSPLLRVNAGGSEYTDTQGNTWEADQAYTSGSWGFYGTDNTSNRGPNHSISGTTDDYIYQTERWGLSGYRFDVSNGTYTVTLHFAETYRTGPGQRVFDVSIEGQLVLDNLDIYSEVGYSTALTKVFNGIVVQDGQLNIVFTSLTEQPEINGIEIAVASDVNNAPVLSPIGNKSVSEGELLQFTISATDPDDDQLTYSASHLPAGAAFNAQTRTFSWAPDSGEAGTYPNVHFQVSDGELTDYEYITITVVPFYEDWDVNSDGYINILDTILVGQHWGETGLAGWIRADVNKDGIINVLDMIIIGQNWTG